MCKYCETNDTGWDYHKWGYDFGELGKFNLTAGVCRHKGEIELDFARGQEDSIFSTAIPVRYCPFCGEKFEKEDNQ